MTNKKTGKVDAAIQCIKEMAFKLGKSYGGLEAEFFWPHNVQAGREFGPRRKAIRTLIESLPDKEEK